MPLAWILPRIPGAANDERTIDGAEVKMTVRISPEKIASPKSPGVSGAIRGDSSCVTPYGVRSALNEMGEKPYRGGDESHIS